MRAKVVLNRGPSAYQPNPLPLGQTGSRGCKKPRVAYDFAIDKARRWCMWHLYDAPSNQSEPPVLASDTLISIGHRLTELSELTDVPICLK